MAVAVAVTVVVCSNRSSSSGSGSGPDPRGIADREAPSADIMVICLVQHRVRIIPPSRTYLAKHEVAPTRERKGSLGDAVPKHTQSFREHTRETTDSTLVFYPHTVGPLANRPIPGHKNALTHSAATWWQGAALHTTRQNPDRTSTFGEASELLEIPLATFRSARPCCPRPPQVRELLELQVRELLELQVRPLW